MSVPWALLVMCALGVSIGYNLRRMLPCRECAAKDAQIEHLSSALVDGPQVGPAPTQLQNNARAGLHALYLSAVEAEEAYELAKLRAGNAEQAGRGLQNDPLRGWGR